MRCESSNHSTDETEQIWLSIYHSLGELCVDSRPPIRKSAGDSLLQTIAAHGHAMRPCTWGKMIEEVFIFSVMKKNILD
jgi:hypothetical protein